MELPNTRYKPLAGPSLQTLTSPALHKSHVANFNTYYGYWYKEDIFTYNSQAAAIRTNVLLEASLAGCWLAVIVWLANTGFLLLTRGRVSRREGGGDRAESLSLKSERTVSSCSRNPYSDRGVYSSVHSNSSTCSRKDLDDLALCSILSGELYRNNNTILKQSQRGTQATPGPKGSRLSQLQARPLLPRDNMETEIM